MKNLKNAFFYFTVTGVFTALIYWVVGQGKNLEIGRKIISPSLKHTEWNQFLDSIKHNLHHPLAILLGQIITIIIVARFFGWIFKKIGQPSVIGEIIAGIFLGPSVVGMYFPEFSLALFPTESLGNLQFLSQIGLILFMFVIGMELDLKVLKNKANEAVVISHASIVIPFALGISLAYFVYYRFAPQGVEFLSFSLFMGIAMSITAFPVLARIVQERGIHKTKLGSIVITCAAADDITAWCLLAAVIAIVKAGSFISSLYVIALAVLYVLLMLFIVKPFFKRVGDLYSNNENLSKPVVAIFFLTLILSSYCTEVIGIHALFGAFMTGVIMPDVSKFRNIFIEKVEDVSLILLLPLFFVFTGLRTQIGLINDPYLWKITGYIILVAVIGKFIGSALAAKFVGQNWKDSLTIGALMNTRGLMELVVLNIGYDLGVLNSEIFTMMVIMALVTTFMTGPALDLINYIFKSKGILTAEEDIDTNKYKILVSFGNYEKGKSLLRLANSLIKKQKDVSTITAMHLSVSDEMHGFNLEDYEKEAFIPIIEESKLLNQDINTIYKATVDIETDIAEIANNGDYDLLLVGLGKSIFEGTLLGKVLGFTTRIINPDRLLDKITGKERLFTNSIFDDRTRQIIAKNKTPLGILVDNELNYTDKIFVPFFGTEDAFLVDYIQKFVYNNNSKIKIIDINNQIENNFLIKNAIQTLEKTYPDNIALVNENQILKSFLIKQDLMVISLDSWKKLVDSQSVWLSNLPSVLIIKP
ncbi:cation:proton antiporter domain-containing protein [Flavobacterium psychrophilum]|uniref:cation:proton antiporter domain-containing protein n=1 Tax=Flavobacterium psychrophilum TaxID=96345 RepID=UPI000B7C11A9|nr:cation:proton antiporter [Flavobacterium psychrophilum]MCB5994580.1 cation:proton antiporter [Flavobacterium psychrophilum]MCB5996719.1 cation:proton antiporter [Flavobacterium psychrophilum]MCB6004093.1 cation:proton antiporter [Flavobacterium psychrophilum]MCB6006558.1 cation:proton antiporter [Flavobacterium psychrophilum]MCB6019048.1 cation:proton antiporter [Flavobacterium psychrophilum]